MAISIKLKRSNSSAVGNVFLVTAASGDTGKLQIQYNGSDIYNNLSGITSDILSGASNTDIYIPLDVNGEIPKGEYYFNFVASAGDSDTEIINFQVDSINPVITPDIDIYAPSYLALDDTSYTVDNGTVSAASRTMTVIYPSGSLQSNLTTSQSNVTTSMYISTSNVWTGAIQAQTTYDITYTIATTILGATTYASFSYQELGSGYNSEIISPDNLLCDVYACIEALRVKVLNAESKRRSDYASLLSDYQYVGALAVQFREAVVSGNTESLEEILAKIKSITNCNGACSLNPSSPSIKIYGINGAPQDTFTLTTSGSSGAATFSGNILNIPIYSGGGGGTLTEVTGVSPISVASGTTTPQISIEQVDETTDGYLSKENFAIFDGKQENLVSGTNIKTVNSTTLLGSGDVSVGVTSVTGTSPISSTGGATPDISMLAATASRDGYLSSTDWGTFNNKQDSQGYKLISTGTYNIPEIEKNYFFEVSVISNLRLDPTFTSTWAIGTEIEVLTRVSGTAVELVGGMLAYGVDYPSGSNFLELLGNYIGVRLKKTSSATWLIVNLH